MPILAQLKVLHVYLIIQLFFMMMMLMILILMFFLILILIHIRFDINLKKLCSTEATESSDMLQSTDRPAFLGCHQSWCQQVRLGLKRSVVFSDFFAL